MPVMVNVAGWSDFTLMPFLLSSASHRVLFQPAVAEPPKIYWRRAATVWLWPHRSTQAQSVAPRPSQVTRQTSSAPRRTFVSPQRTRSEATYMRPIRLAGLFRSR